MKFNRDSVDLLWSTGEFTRGNSPWTTGERQNLLYVLKLLAAPHVVHDVFVDLTQIMAVHLTTSVDICTLLIRHRNTVKSQEIKVIPT